MADVDDSDLASGTKRLYRFVADAYVQPGVGALRLREVTVPAIDGCSLRYAATTVRLRPSQHALCCPESSAWPSATGCWLRAYTPAERDAVVGFAGADVKALRRDLPDLVAFLAGTGARIAEACALRWSAVELAEGTAKLGPVVIRETGKGLSIQSDGKTATSTRTIKLPADVVTRLLARQVEAEPNEWDVVFPSALGKLRDPANTSNDVSELMTDAGHDWATAHTFRHTVATLLDLAGLSAREIANYLGHKHASMTQDVYMSRHTVSERAADLLVLAR